MIIIFFIHTNNALHNVSAQQSNQIKEIPGSDLDDLKWQLKQMEVAVLRQQEQIKALRNRLDAVSTETVPVAEDLRNHINTVSTKTASVAGEEAKHGVEDYLSTDGVREKIGLGLPSTSKYTPVDGYYFPDKEKASIGFKTSDERYSLYLVSECRHDLLTGTMTKIWVF